MRTLACAEVFSTPTLTYLPSMTNSSAPLDYPRTWASSLTPPVTRSKHCASRALGNWARCRASTQASKGARNLSGAWRLPTARAAKGWTSSTSSSASRLFPSLTRWWARMGLCQVSSRAIKAKWRRQRWGGSTKWVLRLFQHHSFRPALNQTPCIKLIQTCTLPFFTYFAAGPQPRLLRSTILAPLTTPIRNDSPR